MSFATNKTSEFVLKTVFGQDVRRVRVEASKFMFGDLKQLLKKQFGAFKNNKQATRITYIDEDQDNITITNQEELEEAFRVSSRSRSLKIFLQFSPSQQEVKTQREKTTGPQPRNRTEDSSFIEEKEGVHWGFTCDVSGQNPIRGPRFHKRGQNYDLCLTEYEKLSDEDKKMFERVDVPARGRFWRKFRSVKQGQQGWRSRRGGRGGWQFWRCGGEGRNQGQNVLFKKFKWCCKALKNCDETQLLEALKSAGGAAKECVEPLRDVVLSIRDKTTTRVLKQINRSPTMIKFKKMLRDLQEKIQQGQVTLFDAPGLILNSNEYAVAIAHLRDVLPKLAVAAEKIAGLLPRLAVELPSLLPKILPVFAVMAFGGAKKPEDDEKKNVNYRAVFVKDDNLPDGAQVAPSTTVTKTWTIKNSGENAWPEDTALLHVGGDLELRAEESRVKIGAVEKNKEVSVSVKLTTPANPGRAWSYWRLVYGAGHDAKRSGLKVWADLAVVKKDVKKEDEEDEGWELPDVPKNSTMIGTAAFGDDDEEEEKTEEKEDLDLAMEFFVQGADLDLRAGLDSLEKEKDVPVVPAPSAPKEETPQQEETPDLGPWAGAVVMLEEMGFDPNRFRDLLKRHNGDIQAIMADMLK